MNGQVIVSPPNEIFDEGIDHWKNVVVVQFIRRISNFSFFQRVVNVLWGIDGEVDLLHVIEFLNLVHGTFKINL